MYGGRDGRNTRQNCFRRTTGQSGSGHRISRGADRIRRNRDRPAAGYVASCSLSGRCSPECIHVYSLDHHRLGSNMSKAYVEPAPADSTAVFKNDIFKGKVLFCTGGGSGICKAMTEAVVREYCKPSVLH